MPGDDPPASIPSLKLRPMGISKPLSSFIARSLVGTGIAYGTGLERTAWDSAKTGAIVCGVGSFISQSLVEPFLLVGAHAGKAADNSDAPFDFRNMLAIFFSRSLVGAGIYGFSGESIKDSLKVGGLVGGAGSMLSNFIIEPHFPEALSW